MIDALCLFLRSQQQAFIKFLRKPLQPRVVGVIILRSRSRLVQVVEEHVDWHHRLRAQVVVAVVLQLFLWRVFLRLLMDTCSVLYFGVNRKLLELAR